jgi:hypothetical protein
MGDVSAAGDEINVVLVDDAGQQVIVPTEGGDRLLPVPQDSVTLAGIRRAARQVREERDNRTIAAIAEATIGRKRPPCESCPA